jgi:D-galactarolactone cycloisomerase
VARRRISGRKAIVFFIRRSSRICLCALNPIAPENIAGHGNLAGEAKIPIAVGESHRTRFELLPVFEAGALDILQPDVGRVGITEGRKIASPADVFHVPCAPHISIGLGPQIAAALHLAAACSNLLVTEGNPLVYQLAT